MPQILRYHVIACHQLLLENLKLTPNATSLQGESLVISVSQVGEATSGRCSFSLGLLSFLFLRAVRVIIMITTNARGNDCSMLATILSVWCVCAKSPQSCLTPWDTWTVTCQTPLSMWFSRQQYWSGLPCPPPGDLPTEEPNLCLLWLLHCRQILYPGATGDMY